MLNLLLSVFSCISFTIHGEISEMSKSKKNDFRDANYTNPYIAENKFETGRYVRMFPNSSHILKITFVDNSIFKFELEVGTEKMCIGQIGGIAILGSDNNTAVFRDKNGCRLDFILQSNGDIKIIETNCDNEHGAQCSFNSVLTKSAVTEDKNYQINFQDPISVVNAIFFAAKTENLEILQCLCDPYEEGDGDTKRLCALSKTFKQASENGNTEMTQLYISEFTKALKNGRITSKVQFEDSEDKSVAKVEFIFDGSKSETMNLINRHGNWYLYSF